MKQEKYIPISIKSDDDGNDYIIPSEMVEEFDSLLEEGYESDDFEKFEEKFDKYMTGGCISQYQLCISESEMKKLTGGE